MSAGQAVGMVGLISVAIGGALGAVARYMVTLLVNHWWPIQNGIGFPWATFFVNTFGSFLFGLILFLVVKSNPLDETLRLLLLTGFLGSFTTFSTFSFETVTLLQSGAWTIGLLNIAANVFACLFAFYVAASIASKVGLSTH